MKLIEPKKRAIKLSELFTSTERGAPRVFTHIEDILRPALEQLSRDYEQRLANRKSTTYLDDED